MCLADELHHSGVGQCGDVTQLAWLVLSNLAQDPLHDLPDRVFGSPGTTCMEGRGGRQGYWWSKLGLVIYLGGGLEGRV